MTKQETISWIFLSIAFASETETANLKEISKGEAEKLLKEENERHMKEHHNHDHGESETKKTASEKKSTIIQHT